MKKNKLIALVLSSIFATGLVVSSICIGVSVSANNNNKDNSTQVMTGTDVPQTTYGQESDLYFNNETYDIYKKINGSWVKIGNAKGSDGQDGTNGSNGKDGADGKDGVDGKDGTNGSDGKDGADGSNGFPGTDGTDGKYNFLIGTGSPDSTLGMVGDTYFDKSDGSLYEKLSSGWTYIQKIYLPNRSGNGHKVSENYYYFDGIPYVVDVVEYYSNNEIYYKENLVELKNYPHFKSGNGYYNSPLVFDDLSVLNNLTSEMLKDIAVKFSLSENIYLSYANTDPNKQNLIFTKDLILPSAYSLILNGVTCTISQNTSLIIEKTASIVMKDLINHGRINNYGAFTTDSFDNYGRFDNINILGITNTFILRSHATLINGIDSYFEISDLAPTSVTFGENSVYKNLNSRASQNPFNQLSAPLIDHSIDNASPNYCTNFFTGKGTALDLNTKLRTFIFNSDTKLDLLKSSILIYKNGVEEKVSFKQASSSSNDINVYEADLSSHDCSFTSFNEYVSKYKPKIVFNTDSFYGEILDTTELFIPHLFKVDNRDLVSSIIKSIDITKSDFTIHALRNLGYERNPYVSILSEDHLSFTGDDILFSSFSSGADYSYTFPNPSGVTDRTSFINSSLVLRMDYFNGCSFNIPLNEEIPATIL